MLSLADRATVKQELSPLAMSSRNASWKIETYHMLLNTFEHYRPWHFIELVEVTPRSSTDGLVGSLASHRNRTRPAQRAGIGGEDRPDNPKPLGSVHESPSRTARTR